MRERGIANYNFIVTLTSDDQDLVNNFGYQREEVFAEQVKRNLMLAMAKQPYITGVSISQVSIDPDGDLTSVEQERVTEDEDDEE